MERIVSLLPSLTEIVCALGQQDRLVGRSHECDHPASVADLPVCTEAKLPGSGSSRSIDDRVRERVRSGLSVYEVDPEQLRTLRPDVVLTQDHCEVCAASLADVQRALADWVGGEPRVVSLAPDNLGEVWAGIQAVAEALGVPDRGRELVGSLTLRVTEIGERTGALAPRPRVACIEWIDPLMSAGNWVPELVALAGGRALLAEPGAHSPWLAPAELVKADPEVVVVIPCGFDIARTREEVGLLEAVPGWADLAAVRGGRVAVADGSQFFNRPGPRLVESLEILCEICWPGELEFGHAGSGWQAL